MPTLSALAFSMALLAWLTMPPASVRPYPEVNVSTRWGKRSSVARTSSGVVAEPPMPTVWTSDTSRVPIVGSWRRRNMWVAVPFQA